jgi:hypothetical protein
VTDLSTIFNAYCCPASNNNQVMRITIHLPDLVKSLAAPAQTIERAVTSGIREAAGSLKSDLRGDVIAAGMGQRLARTWRGKTFPEHGQSLEAAAFVWSRAPKIVDAFDRGVVIRSRRGLFLAIPTAAAGQIGRGASGMRERITPQGWERRTGMKLRFVYRRGRPSLLVADKARINKRGLAAANRRKSGDATVIVFVLVPQVALKKRLDIEAAANTQAARVPSLIARHWPQS